MKKPSDEDVDVISRALIYILISDKKEGKEHLINLYERAYRKGFEAGKKEGTVKIVEKVVYEDPRKWDGLQGGA